jgi:hypothetical protein
MSNYKKIGSIAVGVMFLSTIIKSLAPTIYTIVLTIQQSGSLKLAGILFFVVIILLLLWLFTNRSAIANKLFKDEGDIDIDKSITFPQAVNLVCIFAGLILLSNAIPAIFTVMNSFTPYVRINASGQKIDSGKFVLDFRQFALLAALIIKFAIALYLIYGAPHFVRWQIKRIKKLTEETIE